MSRGLLNFFEFFKSLSTKAVRMNYNYITGKNKVKEEVLYVAASYEF